MRRLLGLVFAVLPISCGDDGGTADGGSTGTTSTTTTGPLCEAGDVQPCDCSNGLVGQQECAQTGNEWLACECAEGTGDSSTGEPDLCGNGEVDDGEQCDDGDDDDTNECSNDCIALCGVMWEATYDPEMAQTVSIREDADGNIAVGALRFAGDDLIPFIETYSPDGMSIASMDFENIPFVDAGTAVVLTDDRPGAFGFGELDVGGGAGLHFVGFDTNGVNVNVPADPLVSLWQDVDNALGIAATPDGNYVVSATIEVAESDDDLWVAKVSAADGSVMWEATHSGPFEGGFSIDRGGQVAVGPDESVYAIGSLRQTFDRGDVVAVKFPAGGGVAEWEVIPVEDIGNPDHFPIGIGVDSGGNVYMSQISFFGVSQAVYYTRIVDGAESWTLTNEDLGLPDDGDFDWPRLAVDADDNLVLSVEHLGPNDRLGAFFGHVTPEAGVRCLERYNVTGMDRGSFRLAPMSDGSVAVAGGGSLEWVGRVRL